MAACIHGRVAAPPLSLQTKAMAERTDCAFSLARPSRPRPSSTPCGQGCARARSCSGRGRRRAASATPHLLTELSNGLEIVLRHDNPQIPRAAFLGWPGAAAALQELWQRASRLARGFRDVSYTAVRREHNELADRLVNEALDSA